MEIPVSCSIAFVCIDSGWAQAYASWALVVLTFITLCVLYQYAKDTRQIANTSMEQFNSSQTPFLALTRDRENKSAWYIENQGNSSALNISIHGNYINSLYPSNETSPFSLSLDPISSGKTVFLTQFPILAIYLTPPTPSGSVLGCE
jgi:hypothetical protein